MFRCTPCSCPSPRREGRGCTPRTCFSAYRADRGCSPRSSSSASREGNRRTSRSPSSACRGDTGYTPRTVFSPFHGSTASFPSRSVSVACRAPRRVLAQAKGVVALDVTVRPRERKKKSLVCKPATSPLRLVGVPMAATCACSPFFTTVSQCKTRRPPCFTSLRRAPHAPYRTSTPPPPPTWPP